MFLNSLVGSNATTAELPDVYGVGQFYPIELANDEGRSATL